MLKAITSYINESMQELELVRWPTRQQAVRLSLIVLGFTVASAAAFGLIDFVLSTFIRVLLDATI